MTQSRLSSLTEVSANIATGMLVSWVLTVYALPMWRITPTAGQAAWVEAFVEDGINQEMIKRGLANCREMYEYPPSLPQFLKACREPSKHESRHQDSKPQLTHEYIPCAPEEAAVHIANIRALIEKNGGILKNVTEELGNGTH